ncbi:MAG: hypothetical protein HY769_07370 [Candidatus Stahlbacteria bacterium]|nr:hypothetical protein [Candidatus Stahlbacteria bacterium]
MKKGLVYLLLGGFLFGGCNCGIRTEEETYYEAPNWTSDNKICFLELYYVAKYRSNIITGDELFDEKSEVWVCEINNDGTGKKQIKEVMDADYRVGLISSSSASNWIVFNLEVRVGGNSQYKIYVIKRDGSELKEICSGMYPDFSPDASRIVYQKLNQGLWIMNREGSGDKQIVENVNATHPAWSSGGGRIIYEKDSLLILIDTIGNQIGMFLEPADYPDWGPSDSNALSVGELSNYKGKIIYLFIGIL